MSDEKKKVEDQELNEEQMEKVAGGIIRVPEDRLKPFVLPEIPDLPEPPLPYPELPNDLGL